METFVNQLNSSNIALIVAILFGLFFGSQAYDGYVGRRQEKDPTEGYTSFYVVFGVTYTQIAIAAIIALLVNIETGLLVAVVSCLAYLASGIPMIAGDMHRSPRIRRRLQVQDALDNADRILDELKDHWNDDDTA